MRQLVLFTFILCNFAIPLCQIASAADKDKFIVVNEMVILDEKKASHFVDSLDDLAQVRQKIDLGRNDPLRLKNTILTEKNYAPYRNAVKRMNEESPDHYAAIKAVAERHGFESAEDWAETADGVMLTFFYIQQEEEGRTIEDKMREQLRPEMLAKVPESHRYMVEDALRMTHKINEVPEGNEKIVRGILPELAVAMRKNL